jgi:hypothetical protein
MPVLCDASNPIMVCTLFLSASYAVFLAVLLPVAALQAGLLVAAAGMCKEPRVVS